MTDLPSPRAISRRAALAAAGALALTSAAGPAASATASGATTAPSPAGAVFVQLNAESGNRVAAYHRAPDGRLYLTGRYGTGGLGGTTVDAPVDALASQDSLVVAGGGRVLVAVNAGSDTVTTFAANGSKLRRTGIVPAGGRFPVSIAVRGDLVYVLSAGGSGAVSGFRLRGARLVPLPGSTRSLGLANADVPRFITAPAQVGISPDRRALVVTTKANGTVLGFGLDADGLPAAAPVVTTSAGPVPFSFVWTGRRTLHVTQAGDGRIASYAVGRDGAATLRGTSAPSGGAALCWVVAVAGGRLVGANTGSGTLSSWTVRDGVATLAVPVAAEPGGAPIDLATSRDGRFLYSQNPANGTVDVLRVDGGRLVPVQTVTGLPVYDGGGMEGIAAT